MVHHVLFPPLVIHVPFFFVSTAPQFMSPVPAISFCLSSFIHTHTHRHTYIYSYIERFVFCFSKFFLSTHKK